MSCKDVKALLLNHIFSFKQLTAGLFMGIFYDVLTDRLQTYCRFNTCIIMELASGLVFFGFVYDESLPEFLQVFCFY